MFGKKDNPSTTLLENLQPLNFNRVLLIGSPGAGKSTLGKILAKELQLPLIHLDTEYFLPNWEKRFSKESWIVHLDTLLEKPQWIMDGNYFSTLEQRIAKADVILWLRLPTWKALYRTIKRRVMFHNNSRPDVTEGCDERLSWHLIKSVVTYPWRSTPRIRALMKKYGKKKFVMVRG